MPLVPVVFENFPGLDYRQDQVGGTAARGLFNVVLDAGRVARRPAHGLFAAAATTNNIDDVFVTAGSKVVVANGSRLDAFDSAGAAITNVATSAPAASCGTRFAQAGSAAAATVITNGVDAPRTFSGTAFASPAFTGYTPTAARDVALTPWDARTVYVDNANPSRVYFSDKATPTTVGVNNYEDLQPGDGDTVLAVTAWRDLLFVFKAHTTFVFYGTSVGTVGQPVFDYRTVRTHGLGMGTVQPFAGPDGVYYQGVNGECYRTTGGLPQIISLPISPLIRKNSLFFDVIGGDDRYVYFGSVFSGVRVLWTFDTWSENWTFLDTGASSSAAAAMAYDASTVTAPRVFFAFAKRLGTMNWRQADPSSGTTDATNSAVISADYQLMFSDLGAPGVEKELRSTVVHGFGSVNAGWLRDYTAPASATALTLGTFSTGYPAKAHTRRAERGGLFALTLSNVSGAFFDVSRVEAYVREVRGAGERTTG